MTTVNITTSTGAININNNTDQTINPNIYIPTKVCNRCNTIKYITEFNKSKTAHNGYLNHWKTSKTNRQNEYDKENKGAIAKYKKEYREQNKKCNIRAFEKIL